MQIFTRKLLSRFYVGCLSLGGLYVFVQAKNLKTDFLQTFLSSASNSGFYLSSNSPDRTQNSDGNKIYSQLFDDDTSQKRKKNTKYAPAEYVDLTGEEKLALQNTPEYKSIWDYTVKLSMPCQNGTGWILDFEIPTDNTYPTKWFYATNLHVINTFDFKNNDFSVDLPVLPGQGNHHLNERCDQSFTGAIPQINIYKEFVQSSVTYGLGGVDVFARGQSFSGLAGSSLVGSLMGQPQLEPHLTTEVGVYSARVSNPKLFYAAINFLGKRYSDNNNQVILNDWYHKDFGVLEINYPSEELAKAMTDDFYNLYFKKDKQSTKPIDLFAPELMPGKTHAEFLNLGPFYVGGFPGNANTGLSFEMNVAKNRRPSLNQTPARTSSKLTRTQFQPQGSDLDLQLLNKHNQPITGHIDLLKLDAYHDVGILKWGNKKLRNWGYAYSIDNAFLKAGASGSLVVDGQQRLLGLYRMYNEYYNHAFIEAIRSEGLFENGKIIYPKYDLIKGVDGQVSSYKSQLDRFYPNIKTYLRSLKWGDGKATATPPSD